MSLYAHLPSKQIQGIDEIAFHYDIFLVDIIGVVSDAVHPFAPAISCLQKLQHTKKVIFVSNMPRPGVLAAAKLMGYGLGPLTQVFTSGDAVRYDLKTKFADKKIYHLGEARNQDLCAEMPVTLCTDIKTADMVLLSQFIEQGEAVDQFDGVLQDIANRKLPVICANPDRVAMQGNTTRYCAGTFAERLEKMGGSVEYYGKPHRPIYDIVGQQYGITAENKKRVVMIGDTLETDIQGAHTYGIDSLLVLSGNTAYDIAQTQQSVEDYLNIEIAPTWYMSQLQD